MLKVSKLMRRWTIALLAMLVSVATLFGFYGLFDSKKATFSANADSAQLQEQAAVYDYYDLKNTYYRTSGESDMILGTTNEETLVVLSQKKPDSTINVKIDFGEGEGELSLKKIVSCVEATKPKEKATYKMIQAHIEENYGFKVHTAYIAEVKRELGLPMYAAPNAVEKLKKPRQHPTKEMVKAIKETLKFFEIY